MTEAELHERDVRVLDALRALRPDDFRFEAPPESVWLGIDQAASTRLHGEQPTRRRWWIGAAAAAVAGAVTIGAIAVVGGRDQSTVVARAALSSDGLTGAPQGLVGDAQVIERDGTEHIHVDVDGLRAASGEFLEVWLIKPDISGMVSLGTIRADGNYDLPSGLRIADYPIVDVSTEPYDGNPTHSGASLLRGELSGG